MSTYGGHGTYHNPPILGCRLTNSANQSIPSATATALTFDTEVYDTGQLHNATFPARITFPRSGTVFAGGVVDWAAPAAGIVTTLALLLNNTTTLAAVSHPDMVLGGFFQTVNSSLRVAPGDFLTLIVIQSGVAALNSVAAGQIPGFWAVLWPD